MRAEWFAAPVASALGGGAGAHAGRCFRVDAERCLPSERGIARPWLVTGRDTVEDRALRLADDACPTIK
ncbi:hypothetical protein [Roseitranquillus sediminis]|uniref:hypothetical protein n=1 Tax=Roseitranquillus sediminis TaxID=2809051 RepID=UPI001D0C0346|nr:hypothetical protein [Roseitranquillus sediminis]MBM9594111.1 hypothetical protein [Roseitranquillus sediminis]